MEKDHWSFPGFPTLFLTPWLRICFQYLSCSFFSLSFLLTLILLILLVPPRLLPPDSPPSFSLCALPWPGLHSPDSWILDPAPRFCAFYLGLGYTAWILGSWIRHPSSVHFTEAWVTRPGFLYPGSGTPFLCILPWPGLHISFQTLGDKPTAQRRGFLVYVGVWWKKKTIIS